MHPSFAALTLKPSSQERERDFELRLPFSHFGLGQRSRAGLRPCEAAEVGGFRSDMMPKIGETLKAALRLTYRKKKYD